MFLGCSREDLEASSQGIKWSYCAQASIIWKTTLQHNSSGVWFFSAVLLEPSRLELVYGKLTLSLSLGPSVGALGVDSALSFFSTFLCG